MDGTSIESSLEAHLVESKRALEEIENCLEGNDSSADNSELLELKKQLEISVRETETALLQLKKDRLLEAVDDDGYESELDAIDGSDDEQSEVDSRRGDYLESALNEMHAAVEDAVKNGQQQETAHFAEWEAHGRGVASKLMAQMGYIPGKGLGRQKQGITNHIVSTQISGPQKAGLGTAQAAEIGVKKKTKRGGRAKTARKRARLEKEAQESQDYEKGADLAAHGVFSVINKVIGEQRHSDEEKKKGDNSAKTNNSSRSEPERKNEDKDSQRETRELLADQLSKITNCKKRVLHLEEAVRRNAKNTTLLSVLKSKLAAAREELDQAQQRHSCLSKDVQRSFRNRQSEKF